MAQDHMTYYANKKRKAVMTKEGDWVFFKIRPHKQVSLPTKLHPKLLARYYGPFLVEKRVRPMAFKMQLPETVRIHPIFHVSQLKIAIGAHHVEGTLLVELQVDPHVYQPMKVLQKRTIQHQGKELPQVLIQWQEGGLEGATWEEVQYIKQQFPYFNLEDKVDVEEAGNVRKLQSWWRSLRRGVGATDEDDCVIPSLCFCDLGFARERLVMMLVVLHYCSTNRASGLKEISSSLDFDLLSFRLMVADGE
ncbi:uncharacterized protein LOC108339279 [Vigna angularis]|uniref:uncharacterized protein LOC108339279 n=1 Tax=Phaseolus angularis TaxID=3914 RepID=UPI000809A6A7|nr:uncharacterized protein LOC108339279 [Vigna angularis]